ncbi:glycoside hydrolase family 31 protein [Dellaglioa carnosa]|uniref:Glycoside hydrolase family 31 protein n=1 Tax=Dellaglioa carnosa TaxID=2995136 RepID=A0ABT4JLW7_9LACO|nr:TIM-barrel domain-containing protein [Dellaglioa carnosa]MCZ2491333.1 glycoside hydrolase family 31 protein [Dellaglioa carnosa]MCZ2494411.1 glycoside hydrolase family 31 protein [Dellaglioa carnosa]MDK1731173.1 glycoside hydrolase family 31 protein [Dellaglioa carnosa]
MFFEEKGKLVRRYDEETVWIAPWGENSLRILSSPEGEYPDEEGALTEDIKDLSSSVVINIREDEAEIKNGNISAYVDNRNKIIFKNQEGKILLEEYIRQRAVKHDTGSEDANFEIMKAFNSTLKLKSREFVSQIGGDYSLTTRFVSDPNEKIFGMGQYQHDFLNLKNTVLELAHRNSQLSVPFYISSLGYGFLWNNPGIGKVSFAKNITEWYLQSTTHLDYWITAGETPAQIEESYANVTGKVPTMPDNLLGLWQSKLRYQTQDELMGVAREYDSRGIQLSSIAVDYFHWPEQGEYKFDDRYWPDPKAMVDELKKMGIELNVSIWPTVSTGTERYQEYLEKGYLVKVNRGVRTTMQTQGNTVFMDATNEEAQKYVWGLIKKNYVDYGIKNFWIDVAEPGYAVYDFDNYRYKKGTNLQIGNLYPVGYLKMVYDGLAAEGQGSVVSLVRGAWAGAQKYGALVWSGDIDSSFEAFRNQVNTGLNMGIAGIPWWTTDIGGFHGGNPSDMEFRELMVRWFQYATFSPILRLHGDRQPHTKALGVDGGGKMISGGPNEIWSYGQENEKIFMKYFFIREKLKSYISNLMKQAHEKGTPLMKPLFYDFYKDSLSWDVDNTYMFGDDLLVAPIMEYKQRERLVYLPEGSQWISTLNGETYNGGKSYNISAKLDEIPVFVKHNKNKDYQNNLINIFREEGNV